MMPISYGRLQWDKSRNTWQLDAIPPHVAIRLKQLFPRIPKHETCPFSFPNTPATCADLSWFADRYPFTMSSADSKRLHTGKKSFERNQAEMGRILTPDYIPQQVHGLQPGCEIRHYQSQAIALIEKRKSLLLGDDIGLGKTYTAAGFMLLPGTCPAAVVVETHLQNQWFEKLTSFTTLRVHAIRGTRPYTLPPADVYLFKYSQLMGWVDVFTTGMFKSVVYDEIQQLRTGKESGKGGGAAKLSAHTQYQLGMSATPIYNFGTEIWNILSFVDPNVLGSYGEFMREWANDLGRIENPTALGSFLREQNVFLRRTKMEVGQQMPPINRIIETIDSDPKALQDIATIARELALKVTTGSFVERGQAARELDLLARHATGVGKARSVAAYVRILLDNNIPVMLAGWHRDVYEIWLRELKDFNPVMYTGSESALQKKQAYSAFMNGETNLFVISLRSGAGLDGLQQRCSTVVCGELDWSPKVHEQLFGRVDREGQTEPINAIFLVCEDGSDPPMVDLLGLKSSQATAIIDPDRTFEVTESDTSRIQALAKRFLDKRITQVSVASAPIDQQPLVFESA